jgi:hypothetical protein
MKVRQFIPTECVRLSVKKPPAMNVQAHVPLPSFSLVDSLNIYLYILTVSTTFLHT